jgi:hypothetical protein
MGNGNLATQMCRSTGMQQSSAGGCGAECMSRALARHIWLVILTMNFVVVPIFHEP